MTVRIADSRHTFERFLASRQRSLDALDASAAVQLMIDFYVGVRVDDVDLQQGGDTLLFQWGICDWGSGPSFEYGVTRQLINEVVGGDDAFWQLSLNLHYLPTPEGQAAGTGDHWCSALERVDEFRNFITDSAATTFATRTAPQRVELRLEPAG